MARRGGPHDFIRGPACRIPSRNCQSFGGGDAPLRELTCRHCGRCISCLAEFERCPKAPAEEAVA